MPRTQKLLLTAALAAVCCGAQASGHALQQPPAGDSGGGLEKSRLAAERRATRAEELYQQGEELVQSGRADAAAAVRTFGEALKLYLSLYTAKTFPSPNAGKGAAYRAMMRGRLAHAPECVERYLRLVGGATEFERSQLEAFRGHALGLREEDESRAVFNGSEVDTRARASPSSPSLASPRRRGALSSVASSACAPCSPPTARSDTSSSSRGCPKGCPRSASPPPRG
jgi:hypothetical protein